MDKTRKTFIMYNLILGGLGLVFLVILFVTMLSDYETLKQESLNHIENGFQERVSRIADRVRGIEGHVLAMQNEAENTLAMDLGERIGDVILKLKDTENGFARTGQETNEVRHYNGVFGLGKVQQLDRDIWKELTMAMDLAALQEAASHCSETIWSCYISAKEFISYYPAITVDQTCMWLKAESPMEFFTAVTRQEFWQKLSLHQKEHHKVVWSDRLLGGSEEKIVFVCASAVYWDDEFAGIVVSAVSQNVLQELAEPLTMATSGKICVIDSEGDIMAATGLKSDNGRDVPKLSKFLPEGVSKPSKNGVTEQNGYHCFMATTEGLPWVMLLTVADDDIVVALKTRLTTQFMIALGLVLLVFMANFFLIYFLIGPSIKLAHHFSELSAGKTVPANSVSPEWEPLVQTVKDGLSMKGLVSNLPGVVVRFAMDSREKLIIRYASPKVEDFLGVPMARAMGGKMDLMAMVAPADIPELLDKLKKSEKTGALVEHECGMITESGDAKWVQILATPCMEHQDSRQWDGILLDVSGSRHEMEWKDRLGDIVQSTDEAIFSQTLRGIIMSWNSGATRIYGYSEEDAIGRDVLFLFPPGQRRKCKELLEDISEDKKVERYETVNVGKAGKPLYVSMTLSPIKDDKGNILGISTIAHDFTKRKLAEMALTRRDIILHGVSDAAQQFLHNAEWHASIPQILAQLGAATGFGRAYIFENKRDADGIMIMSRQYEWADSAVEKEQTPWEQLRYHGSELARWEMLANGQTIISQVKDLPLSERRFFKRRSVQFIVVYPIFCSSKWWGFIGFEDCGLSASRTSGAELEALRTAASVLGAAIHRKAAEDELATARAQEMTIGSQIQQTLLIGREPGDIKGASVDSMTIASKEVDGDFTDFIRHNNRHFDLIIGDVMGKGVPAALLGAATKSIFSRGINTIMCASNATSLPTPEEIVMFAQREMGKHLIGLRRFATICYARFDLEHRRVDLVDCGHTPTILYRAKTDECEQLKGDNMPLGFDDQELFKQFSISVEVGDVFLFYSDGLVEAKSPAGEFYGVEKAMEFVKENHQLSASDALRAVYTDLSNFTESDSFSDDLTLVVVKIEDPKLDKLIDKGELEITSDPSNLPRVRKFIRGTCMRGFQFDKQIINHLELEVNESVSNIMRHAYRGRPDRPILIEVDIYEYYIQVSMYHWGEPFKDVQVKTPTFDGNQSHGFGLYLIRQCVDDISYINQSDGSVCIRIIKNLPVKETGDSEGAKNGS